MILRVAHHLRHLGVALPDRRLRDVAEQVVLDTARFVLEWAEPDAAHAAASGEGDAEREAVSAAGVAPRGYAA
ncbi:MAG TPA: hypothetical protein VFS08_06200 [Gemmatimonadaceae bacterium]|nr:hypothetical protein [Gemmatimonadaceae bacterium]